MLGRAVLVNVRQEYIGGVGVGVESGRREALISWLISDYQREVTECGLGK